MKLYAVPRTPVTGGGPFVITGGALTVMLKACVAAGATPLLAVTVPAKVPPTVGVPLMTPALLSDMPVGSAPGGTLKVGAGNPLAV